MTLARTNVHSQISADGHGTGNFVTSSFTPPDNSLLVVCVATMRVSSATDLTSSITCSGGGWTYTPRVGIGTSASVFSVSQRIFTAPVTTGASMTLTIGTGGIDMQFYAVSVVAYTGYDTGTPTGATGTDSEESAPDGAHSHTLSGAPASTSEVVAAITLDKDAAGTTPGADFTEIHDLQTGSSGGVQSQIRTGSTSTTVAWVDTNTGGNIFKFVAASVEIIEAAGAPAGAIEARFKLPSFKVPFPKLLPFRPIHSPASIIDVVAIDLVIDNLTQAQNLDNVVITQDHQLVIDALTQAQTLDNIAITQVHELVIQALTQAQELENVVINTATNIVIQDITQAQTLDNVVLTQIHELVIQALTQAQTLDNITITQVHQLVINALTQAQTLDNITITQVHQLVIQALTQAQTLDNLTVDSNISLVIANLTQAQTLDNLAITQVHQLIINALTQAQTLDNLTLTQVHQLVIQALTQAQTLTTMLVTTAGALRPTIDVVAVALIRALTGIPASRVSTTLPKDTSIWADGFIQAVGISEESGMYVPLHSSTINVSCWATNPGSGKPPWGKANQLAEALKVKCLDHTNFPILLNLTSFGNYSQARVHSAYFVSEPHRIPSDEGSYARYDGDLVIHWVPQ